MAYSKQVASHSAGDTILDSHLDTEFDYIYNTVLNEGIGTSELTDANVTTAKLAADAVNGTKIADDAIDSEHLVDGSIDTAHVADDAITTAKILDLTLISIFGVWNDRDKDGAADTVANNTVYEAATDGFAIALVSSSANDILGYTDSSNPPTTLRVTQSTAGTENQSATMPVKKGHFWKFTGATTVYWLPIGQ